MLWGRVTEAHEKLSNLSGRENKRSCFNQRSQTMDRHLSRLGVSERPVPDTRLGRVVWCIALEAATAAHSGQGTETGLSQRWAI